MSNPDYQPINITAFFVCTPDCPICLGEGHVCEDHPDKAWAGMVGNVEGACECGAAGMPCPKAPVKPFSRQPVWVI